jgi:hypothetical protein
VEQEAEQRQQVSGAIRELPHAPEDLTRAPLRRLGEGIGKVVYASEHWVVKRERSPSAIIALIVIWKILRRLERMLPGSIAKRLVQRPARQIRFLRVLMQAIVLVLPKGIWYTTHIGHMRRMYRARDRRGKGLARTHLTGTSLIPETVVFPPTRVAVRGWPGWLTVSEATERVEATLDQRLADLAGEGRFQELEQWLDRFLKLRPRGWRRGLFSVDLHLKNFGVTGDHIVLLDAGGLTDSWEEIERRLRYEEREAKRPHQRLGLGEILRERPDIALRFNNRWRELVSREGVRQHWPPEAK